MIRFWGRGLVGVGMVSVLAACSGGSDGKNVGANGDAGSGAGGGAAEGCVSAPDAVFTPQQFGETDLIRGILLEGDTLYFRTEDTLLEVSTKGGSPKTVADLSSEQPSEFWLQGDAVIVRSDADLLSVPKAGGAVTHLGAALDPPPTNFAPTQLSGTDFYWVAEASAGYDIYHRALSGSSVDTLYSTKDELRDLQLVSGKLYFVDKTMGDIESVAVAGGAPSKLTEADGSDDIVAGDDQNLYVIGTLGPVSVTNFGLYRQPISGDAAVLLETGSFITDALDTAIDSSGAYFAAPANVSPNQADPSDVSPALLFASGADTSAQLRWCIDSSYTLHALATDGTAAYVSFYNARENKAGIARVALP